MTHRIMTRRDWRAIAPCLLLLVACDAEFSSAYFRGEPTRSAYARLQAHADAQRALGTPMTIAFASNGQVSGDRDSGTANESIAVAGPRGRGTLHVEATKRAGQWKIEALALQRPGQPDIDLLAPAGRQPMPAPPR